MNTIVTIALSSSPDAIDDARGSSLAATSASSFLTASPPALSHPVSSRSSSVHTLSVGKSTPPEAHKEYGVDGAVVAGNGPMLECAIRRVGSPAQNLTVHTRPASTDSRIGPPPPSPPASYHHQEEYPEDDDELEPPEPPRSPTSVVTFEEPMRKPSSSSLRKPSPRIPPSIGRRSSADTEGSYRSVLPPPRITRTSTNQSDAVVDVAVDDDVESSHLYPQPHKPSRRYTTGSASPIPSSSSRVSRSAVLPHSHEMEEIDGELGELASDIQLQAEQIRKERLSKRAAKAEAEKTKAGQDAEKALTRTMSRTIAADEPLVGNVIGEGHANYVLMFNMLTGIRIAVSRCQAKIRRPLTDEDFTAAHKYSFDMYVHAGCTACPR